MKEQTESLAADMLADEVTGRRPGTLPPHQTIFTIGDLARDFQVTLRALRFYEDRGLLNPRRDGMTRLYSRRDRARLKLILMGKKVGFPLSDIKAMLDLYDLRDGQVTQLRVSLNRFREQVAKLEAQKAEIEIAIRELSRTCDIVEGMLKEKTKP